MAVAGLSQIANHDMEGREAGTGHSDKISEKGREACDKTKAQ